MIGVIDYFFLARVLFFGNFFFLIFSILFSSIIYYLSSYVLFQYLVKNESIYKNLRLFLSASLLVSLFLHLLCFWLYCNSIYVSLSTSFSNASLLFLPTYNVIYTLKLAWFFPINVFYIKFSMDFFGFILLFLAYIVGFISLLVVDTRLYWSTLKYLFAFNIFSLIVFIFVSTTNIIFFFLSYEMLLLPSFLFVYFVSPSRRAIPASIYFVVWTQIGSFIVLCTLAYVIGVTSCYDFNTMRLFNFTQWESFFIYLGFFIGFGIKVPIWPFHYWLTKTHVEAPSGFSIYLSGFLVKSALYGFYKFTNIINNDIYTVLFLVVVLFGVLDASMKMWGQVDLKKMVAYGTIQEMNLIFFVFLFGDTFAVLGGILFSATHAFLSSLMFFVVDCVYRRYHTRSLLEVNGILHLTPNLGLLILFMCIFFAGLPGTIKYISEFYIFSGLLEISPTICFFVMIIANVFGLIGFCKAWFNSVFGLNHKNLLYIPFDLTWKEIFISVYCFFFLFIFSFFINFVF